MAAAREGLGHIPLELVVVAKTNQSRLRACIAPSTDANEDIGKWRRDDRVTKHVAEPSPNVGMFHSNLKQPHIFSLSSQATQQTIISTALQ